jgi:diadenosine tetraphosphate (Ap4A) HIT family hydrolase
MLRFSEKILGRSACFIYTRPKGNYATYRSDGHVGASPFINEKVEKEYTYHNVILNKYPYKKFSQHFLIVPKREVNALLELDPEEQYELIQIMGEYEAQ